MSKYQFPSLKNETEFESLVNDLCVEKYGIEFQVYGRKGQKQNGIDGLSFSKNEKQIIFQCKNKFIIRDDKKIQDELLKDIEVEVESANTKFTNIDTFIFANSFKQDTVLQDKATELTTQYKFTVIVWSWEEIEGLLEKYSNVAKVTINTSCHCPDYKTDSVSTLNISSLLLLIFLTFSISYSMLKKEIL